MTTLDMTDDEGVRQEESPPETALAPEMELALGRVLMPVFAGYLHEMGFLAVGEDAGEEARERPPAKKGSGDEMSLEETVNRLAGAQLGHTFRLARIEDGFQQIAVAVQQLTRIAEAADGRQDSLEEGQAHVDARLNALIDSEIQLAQRVETLRNELSELNGRFEQIDAILERVAELQIENAGQLNALIVAQARTDELIRALINQNGSTGKAKARATAKKAPKKKGEPAQEKEPD